MRLKELREERDITQADLGKALNISPSAIGMYEQGRREPSLDVLRKLAEYFKVSTDYLIGRTEIRNELMPGLTEKAKTMGVLPKSEYAGGYYYLDPETARIANEMKDNPGRRVLFDATSKLSPDEIKQVQDFVNFITRDKDFTE